MGTHGQRGFTIIEVTLFLALTSLLAVLLLGGWTTMINTQRYKDSLKTVQTFVQEQYSLVYNVQNTRQNSLLCTNGTVTDDVDGLGELRGQSDCVIMGRYLHLDKGVVIGVSAIVGNEPANDSSTSDIASILAYNPKRSDSSLELTRNELQIPWGAVVVTGPGSATPRSAAIAIIRTPNSGIVHTYAVSTPNDGSQPTVVSIVIPANEQSDTPLCMDPGNPLAGGQMGVLIRARASSQSYIETVTDQDPTC